jgi:hypothetical protein
VPDAFPRRIRAILPFTQSKGFDGSMEATLGTLVGPPTTIRSNSPSLLVTMRKG